ncbi:metalloregulator ArsR/SmtB family transcription factor [Neiella marina]|uniref:Metalloregulator ArsR/SmtB family transcription factor n=1 Tax=Neiella holothuriorum TaxID=2870530 RepID=A0ABS7EM18_9GAMM|nr:metalloregulator ArsR/SmtB family transcription factor [Neiella holothuriorum]MBW8192908.1 metalloregulator ArsR/SmtB family transcription factor [Neiella holothuriorum]
MELEQVAKSLKELGHPTRLRVYHMVVRAGHQGIAVGTLQQKLEVPGSTLSHHVSGLVSAGLIEQRREGRTLFCVAQYQNLQQVIGFLQDECCADQ